MQPFKNLREIAQSLNLSPATVSRVLNGKAADGRISRETQERVKEAVESRGLLRNAMARSLKTSRTQTLGLLIPDISNPFFATIAQSIVRSSRGHGFSVLLCDNEEDETVERHQLQLLEERRVDGVIAAPVGTESSHWIGLKSRSVPLCLVDRYFGGANIPFVSSDNKGGACLAMGYLLGKGHRSIAVIQGNPHTTTNVERIEGCREALLKKGMELDTSMVVGVDFGELSGYEAALQLLKRPTRPTAIFAFSNMISMGVMRAAAELGYSIPQDVSLVAFDEQFHSAYTRPPLTTIAQNREYIGELAVEQVLKILAGTEVRMETRVPTELIERKSVISFG